MNFNGPAKPLDAPDVNTIAGYLGCHIAAVRAVLAVEAAGKGFDAKRRPKMLFEPHIFWRELKAGSKRDHAATEGLAYAAWKAGAYPSDSYPRLLRAMAIDETAALRSASWGLGQVMGFNHKAAGFASVQQYVQAMTYSEGAQLYAMARFIVSKRLQKHLRSRDWAAFAKGYNGAGYAKHSYHTRLAAAYAKRPNAEQVTPAPAGEAELNAILGLAVAPAPASKPKPAPPKPTPKPASVSWFDSLDNDERKRVVMAVQKDLLGHGYVNVGGIDGLVGDRTRSAIRDFRPANGLPAGDHIDAALIEALKRPDAVRPVISPERADATLGELRDKGSVIADASTKTGKGAIATVVAGVGAVATQVVESAGGLMSLGPALDPFRWLIEEYGVWIFGTTIAGMGGFFWYQARRSGKARVADHRSGNTSVVDLPGKE